MSCLDDHENLIQRLSEADDLDNGALTNTTNDNNHHHHHRHHLFESVAQQQEQHHNMRNNNHHHKKQTSSEISPTKSDSSKEENNNLKPGSNSLMTDQSPLSPDMKRRRFDTESPVPSDVSFLKLLIMGFLVFNLKQYRKNKLCIYKEECQAQIWKGEELLFPLKGKGFHIPAPCFISRLFFKPKN